MKKRYDRNIGTITEAQQELLGKKRVCVMGCGGLGGGAAENLVRMGVGHITAVDGDVFDETNLNRQVLSNESNIGMSKAEEAKRQMGLINSQVEVVPVNAFADASNMREIISGHDAVVDALDNTRARLLLAAACEKENIPIVHGAVAGWNGQVAVIMPGDELMDMLYGGCDSSGDETETGNPPFTPAVISALQAAETVKLLTGNGEILRSRLLTADLLDNRYEIIEFGE